ncbi:hypothetical protein J4Q44_G00378820 [Coregonus suidteri]|uniref:Uncharacterized protein n=1 Tax=Coregonus suidteri TaxID=861788 RepID=A0AAN8KGN3_9TELE
MTRSISFPGIAPRSEFSTRTTSHKVSLVQEEGPLARYWQLPHTSPVMARRTLTNGSSPRLPHSPSSDNLLYFPPQVQASNVPWLTKGGPPPLHPYPSLPCFGAPTWKARAKMAEVTPGLPFLWRSS